MEVNTPWFVRWANWPLPPAVDEPSGATPDPKPVATGADTAVTRRDANQGSIGTGILTAVGAGTPVITAASGMDWKLALVFSGAAILLGVGVLVYFLRIKNKQVLQ